MPAAKRRSVFEEVSADRPRAVAAQPGEAERRKRRARRLVAGWLFGLAGLVVAMVLVGGMTRLTDSGLSMVSWHPVMEAIPPLTAEDWAAEFEKYQQTAQYRIVNSWMTVEDFKSIYWWEWAHRQFGRVIGLVWAVGLAAFLVTRTLPQGYLWPVVFPGLLGGVQAVVGMWMVDSGVRPESELLSVAPYRLAIHLSLAFLILAALVWPAWRLLREEWALLQARRRRPGRAGVTMSALVGLTFAQIVLGALVAGNDAGRGYPDWPLMNGYVLPPEAGELAPWWRNFIETDALTQFNHRVFGYALAAMSLVALWAARRTRLKALTGWAAASAALVWAQMAWGIVTVMNGAPLWLALIHQAMAIALWIVVLRARFSAVYPVEQSLREGTPAAKAAAPRRAAR